MSETKTDFLLGVAKQLSPEFNNKEFHYHKLADLAIKKGLIPKKFEKNLYQDLGWVLNTNANRKDNIFVKVPNGRGGFRKGIYRLKRTALDPVSKITKKTPSVEGTFSGKAGEYAVAANLLFWGFNVSFPAVDRGVDLIAEINGCFSFVQVKTRVLEEGKDSVSFPIPKDAFDRTAKIKPFYVFVVKREGALVDYIYVPFARIKAWCDNEILKGKGSISVLVKRCNNGKEYKIGDENVNSYVNNPGELNGYVWLDPK